MQYARWREFARHPECVVSREVSLLVTIIKWCPHHNTKYLTPNSFQPNKSFIESALLLEVLLSKLK